MSAARIRPRRPSVPARAIGWTSPATSQVLVSASCRSTPPSGYGRLYLADRRPRPIVDALAGAMPAQIFRARRHRRERDPAKTPRRSRRSRWRRSNASTPSSTSSARSTASRPSERLAARRSRSAFRSSPTAARSRLARRTSPKALPARSGARQSQSITCSPARPAFTRNVRRKRASICRSRATRQKERCAAWPWKKSWLYAGAKRGGGGCARNIAEPTISSASSMRPVGVSRRGP